jgi:dihydrofolate reductase
MLVRDNVVEEIARLKEQPGKNIEVGGANLASTLIQPGLIDEYWLYVNPVILGGGKRMFPALDDILNLQLVDAFTFGSGVVRLRYRPDKQSRAIR